MNAFQKDRPYRSLSEQKLNENISFWKEKATAARRGEDKKRAAECDRYAAAYQEELDRR